MMVPWVNLRESQLNTFPPVELLVTITECGNDVTQRGGETFYKAGIL
jgi:hypothetical protein